MSRSPHLVTSICYVTARYIPGCRDIGRTLTPAILTFLENTYTTTIHDADQELAMLQSLMILCTFTRWTLIGKEPNSCCDINFWHVKATSECFARRIKLHLSAAALKMQLEAGKKPSKANAHTRRYLYWLWFYTLSHHTSVVTRNPPSLRADASLRSASTILACLESDENISLLLSEVQLCLLWEKLGVKDISLKEWWCSTELQCSQTSPAFDITFDDVDMALDEWKENSPAKAFEEFRKGILRFNPDYHSHYMRFCLNTYFIRHICSTNLQPDEILGIKRSVDSAVSVLELSCHMNPLMRDQLRYTSGFIIITISFCSNFVLEAIQRFPSIFPDSTEKLTLVSKTATLLCDLDVDKELGACAAGEWIIRRIDAMSKFPNHRQLVSLHQMTVPEAEDGTTPIADVRGEPGMEYLDLWGFNIDQSTLDTTFEFFESF
ncbi:hypothetical protein CRV24_008479 [Beauveria bassiana]|nr:hypothetical protein CRV24_008479 [Beauveria bassiana]